MPTAIEGSAALPTTSASPRPRVPRQRPVLRIGPLTVAPVVLAPMAGVTDRAFRRLCREFSVSPAGEDTDSNRPPRQGVGRGRPAHRDAGRPPPGLFVSEMVSARALVARNPQTRRLLDHDPEERPRSVQLYAVDPGTARAAARILVQEERVDHVDLNFGCPVPKVTRTGGGAALPWKGELFRSIVGSVVAEGARRGVPVTVKMRLGIDGDHLTYLEAGRLAEAEGAAAVALHARTAAQAYSGAADWSAIRALKSTVTHIPVLGNGDVWSSEDAVRMLDETGCDGVVVGRGCLGRPWLFRDLAAGFAGSPARVTPTLAEVAATVRRHAEYLCECSDEGRACREIRGHLAWYFKGFPVGSGLRAQLASVDSFRRLDELLGALDPAAPWPGEPAEGQRGRAGTPKRVALPDGWLRSRELTEHQRGRLAEAETAVSGG